MFVITNCNNYCFNSSLIYLFHHHFLSFSHTPCTLVWTLQDTILFYPILKRGPTLNNKYAYPGPFQYPLGWGLYIVILILTIHPYLFLHMPSHVSVLKHQLLQILYYSPPSCVLWSLLLIFYITYQLPENFGFRLFSSDYFRSSIPNS